MAIARDTLSAATSLSLDNPTSGNAYTRAFDCGSGSLRRVWFAYFGSLAGTDSVTGVTYAGVSMVFVGHSQTTGGRWAGLYFLDAPATGSNNFVATVSPNDTIQGWASCYTGAKQTGAVDASGVNAVLSSTSNSKAITVVAANCWGIGFVREESGTTATWSNAITNELSGTGGGHFADSNGTIGTGSQTATITFGGLQNTSLIWASFEPDTGGGAVFMPRQGLNIRQAVNRSNTY